LANGTLMPGRSALDSRASFGHPACGSKLAGFGEPQKGDIQDRTPRRGIGITEEEAHETS
jgi:hypothetical protein